MVAFVSSFNIVSKVQRKGLQGCNSPMCTLSQNGYSDHFLSERTQSQKFHCSFHLYCKSGSQPQPSLPPRLCPPPPPPLAFLLHAPSAQPAQARGMSCVCAVELHLSYLDALQLHSRSCKHHRWGPRTDTNTPTWWQREVTPKGALPIAVCHTSATREEPGKPKHPPRTKTM